MISLLLFLFVFGIYIHFMAPTISVGDTGEFCTTSVILGIAHSPGYPLFSLLGKIFSTLIPFGNLAYRVNLMSVIFACLCVYTIYNLFLNFLNGIGFMKKLTAVSLSLCLAFSFSFFKNSIQAEVFSLNSLIFVLIVLIIFSKGISFISQIAFSAFLFGLGVGNHHTIFFVIPLVILWRFLKKGSKLTLREVLIAFIFFLLGFSVCFYLPVRTLKNPGFDWGNPENMRNFVRVITRADYGTFRLTVSEAKSGNGSWYLKQILRFVKGVYKDYHFVFIFLLLFSFVSIYSWRDSLPVFMSFFLSGPVFILIANQPFDAQSEGILERFYMLPEICLVILAWIGMENLFKKRIFFAIPVIFLPIFVFTHRIDGKYLRNNYLAYDYGKNLLCTFKEDAIFFMDGGDDTFYSLGYLCFAEKRRRDLALHDRGGLVFKNIYGDDFRSLTRDEKEKRRNKVESRFLNLRPIYYSTFNEDILPGVKLYPCGVTYHTEPVTDFFNFYSLRNIYEKKFDDYRMNALAPIYQYFIAEIELKEGRKDDWFKSMRYLALKYPEVLWLKTNLAFKLHNVGYDEFNRANYDFAKKIYELILTLNSDDENALVNLGAVEEKINNLESAKQYYLKAIKLNPSNAQAYYNLGVVYWREENWEKVIEMFGNVLKYQPDNMAVMNYIDIARRRLESGGR